MSIVLSRTDWKQNLQQHEKNDSERELEWARLPLASHPS
jgi:hypothetical protein